MYVSLEPCSHWGRTPPCVDAILDAGIKRLVVAMKDPNPVNNGKSLRLLKQWGVEVLSGVCEDGAMAINRPFIKVMTKRLPYVTAKIAQTLDGKIATRTGDSKWITSEATRALAKKKRNDFDAILVGIDTILKDDPQLNAPGKRIKKVVLDSSLKIYETSRIFKGSLDGQVIVATTKKANRTLISRFEAKGVRVIVCPEKQGWVDLKWLLKELAKSGIASILIEGGGRTIGSALREGLVDTLHIYIAPKIVGDASARSSVDGLVARRIADVMKCSVKRVQTLGEDIFIEAEI